MSMRVSNCFMERGDCQCAISLSRVSPRTNHSSFLFNHPERVTTLRMEIMTSMHLGIKSGKPGKAAAHSDYILREGPYRKGNKSKDLKARGFGNLPPGINTMREFWKAADRGERANGAAFREIVAALPRELTLGQQEDLVKDYISRVIPHKPHDYVIHCPEAALGEGLQPHAHVMYNDRIPDGIHRRPEQFFARFNAAHPERGGCRKDSGGLDPVAAKEAVRLKREIWAEVQNEHLARHGHEARVDARSYRARGIRREVEHHLGPAAIRGMSLSEKAEYRQGRASGSNPHNPDNNA